METKDGWECTVFAVGWMYESLTVFALLPTVVANHPKPFVNAPMGSFWKSSNPGIAAPLPDCLGVFVTGIPPPNPVNLPPCDGGTDSEREEFSLPSRAKYASLRSFLLISGTPSWDAGDPVRTASGVLDRDVGSLFFGCCGLGWPGTYSLPSAFAASLSFHSSPTSPSYLSFMVESSNVRPSDCVMGWESKKSFHGSLPPCSMRRISEVLKASMVMERTKEM